MTKTAPNLNRMLPPIIIVGLLCLGYALGLHHYLTLQALAENRGKLEAFVVGNQALAMLLFAAIYTGAVALSVPGATALTVIGGFLFGAIIGGMLTLLSAVLGAAIIFKLARTTFGANLAHRAGPFLDRISSGFEKDAFNYLLFLRLTPVFPFWLVNIGSALANVPLRTFVLATAIGIIPGTFAFSFIGQGLGSVLDAQAAAHAKCLAAKPVAECPYALEMSSLVTPLMLLSLMALGLVALIPIYLRRKNHHV
jgi:uncharacterized membrane protein YdjX (TVP38/TMEM64 family)